MAKDTFYFSHDYNARNDAKIKKLLSRHGYLGYGIFWAIIEDLYNNANALPLDCESIAFDLRTSENIVESIINDFDLFVIENDVFGSHSIQKRLEERDAKSIKARESAFKRWNKDSKDANALPTQSDCNAIKESKEKELKGIKLKEIKDNIDSRKLKFASTLEPFLSVYGRDFLNDFYKYWTEPNKSNTIFKQELEKTWSLDRRLETWAKNDKNFHRKVAPKETKSEERSKKNIEIMQQSMEILKQRQNGIISITE